MNPFNNKTFEISKFKPFDITTVPGHSFCLETVITKLSNKTTLANPGTANMLGGVIIMLSNEIVWLQNDFKKKQEEDTLKYDLSLHENKLREEELFSSKEEKLKSESLTAIAEREKLTRKLENLSKLKDIKEQNEKLLEHIKKLEQDSIFSPCWS